MSKGLCGCGCGQPTEPAPKTVSRLGWRKGEPRPYYGTHGYRRVQQPQFQIDQEAGCWVWTGCICKSTGYGMMHDRSTGKPTTAHRWMWRDLRGEIPAGLDIDHLCRNRTCVNPDHLEPVTHAENMRRGAGTRLSDEEVQQIRNDPAPPSVVARKYGTNRQHVYKIKKGLARA